MTNKTAVELVEEGKKRLSALRDRQHAIAVRLEATKQQLADTRLEAELEFNTSDLVELRELFRKREEANAVAATDFTMALDEIDAALRRTERALEG